MNNCLCIVSVTFHGKLGCLFTENNLLCTINIIHGYLFSRFMHRSTLSMDTISHFSCKVTLSADNVTFFMHRSTLFTDTNSHFSCKVILSMDDVTLCAL